MPSRPASRAPVASLSRRTTTVVASDQYTSRSPWSPMIRSRPAPVRASTRTRPRSDRTATPAGVATPPSTSSSGGPPPNA
ncbi:hypothetical protein [Pseudonocardia sp. GCM10023141]|uniref:hypothetical protein n=1 Tax=Pseudonocardia sp. GCM10023141 TaxID=3252653 RepID=UPI00361D6A06